MRKVTSLRGRWLFNTIGVLFALGMVCVMSVTAISASYYYSSMESDMKDRAASTTEFFADYLNQNYNDFELILVDDGSPDRCPEMCDAYAEKDSRVKVIHKPNGGLSDARNAGINASIGDYIFNLLSNDDADEALSEYVES